MLPHVMDIIWNKRGEFQMYTEKCHSFKKAKPILTKYKRSINALISDKHAECDVSIFVNK